METPIETLKVNAPGYLFRHSVCLMALVQNWQVVNSQVGPPDSLN